MLLSPAWPTDMLHMHCLMSPLSAAPQQLACSAQDNIFSAQMLCVKRTDRANLVKRLLYEQPLHERDIPGKQSADTLHPQRQGKEYSRQPPGASGFLLSSSTISSCLFNFYLFPFSFCFLPPTG